MDCKMPPIVLVGLCEHCTLVYGCVVGHLVHRQVMPCLVLLAQMHWQPLPGFLVEGMFGEVWGPLGIAEKFTTRQNCITSVGDYSIKTVHS